MNHKRNCRHFLHSLQRAAAGLGAIAAIACLSAAAPRALAQEEEPPPFDASEPPPLLTPTAEDGGSHTISGFEIEYATPNPSHPEAEDVLPAAIQIVRTEDGWVAPRNGGATALALEDVQVIDEQRFFDSALVLIAPAVLERYLDLGLIGVYVQLSPEDFTVRDGQIVDLRPAGDTIVTIRVTTGVVTQIQTIGMGAWIPDDEERVNNPRHERIRLHSPVQPVSAGSRTSLLDREALDDYVFLLNRHPGRRVDIAVAPTGVEQGAVALDYIVAENRPWFLYAQLSNTGTDSTDDLRERFGFVHNQLTGADDIFSLDYITSNFDELNAVTASYERPIAGDYRLRWRAYGSWNEYTASDVGLPGFDFDGRGFSAGAEIIWNFYQDRQLFLDFIAGARWEQSRVRNPLAALDGEAEFVIPYGGLRLERFTDSDRSSASLFLEGGINTAGDEDELGRTNADPDWLTLQWSAAHSFYLDPFFAPTAEEGTPTLAHEVALSAHGQFAFGDRLIPTAEIIAGGLYTVRGFPEAVVAGDTGFIATAEYRFHVPRSFEPDPQPSDLFGRPFRFAPQYQYGPTDWDLILRAFVDLGRTIATDRLSFEQNDTLIGAGIGIELALSRHFIARLDWGFALRDVERASGGSNRVDAGDNELHFVITVVF